MSLKNSQNIENLKYEYIYGSVHSDGRRSFNLQSNKHLIYTNSSHKGYVQITINLENVEVVYKYVSTVKSPKYSKFESKAFVINHNNPV